MTTDVDQMSPQEKVTAALELLLALKQDVSKPSKASEKFLKIGIEEHHQNHARGDQPDHSQYHHG